LIAVTAKDRLVVLEVPTDQSTTFKLKKEKLFGSKLSCVAWKYNDENLLIIGSSDATTPPIFDLYNLNGDVSIPIAGAP